LINKKTVFVLGAGASCPYGYPSGSRLRELICFNQGFLQSYEQYLKNDMFSPSMREESTKKLSEFIKAFDNSRLKSIDVFMANNPKLAPTGKYIVAYEVLRAEHQSLFGEEAKRIQEERAMTSDSRSRRDHIRGTPDFQGGDWYSYLYNRLIEGLVGKDALPDFSNGNLAFITFNYDRSLEHFLYESLSNSFTEVSEAEIIKCLKKLKILHVYGQIAPLKWQSPDDYVDYKPQVDESLLNLAANNIRTIYEEKQNPELIESQNLLKQADKIFFLGFGYAPENMGVLGLPDIISTSREVYGTAFGAEKKESENIHSKIFSGIKPYVTGYTNSSWVKIEDMDCLKLLRNYL
jgi:hypothetical protein